MMRLHRRLGHPSSAILTKMLKRCQVNDFTIEAASILQYSECPDAGEEAGGRSPCREVNS